MIRKKEKEEKKK